MRAIGLFTLLIFFISCEKNEQKLIGIWQKSYVDSGFDHQSDLESFQIKKDSITLHYEVNINETQPYEMINSFISIGTNGELKFPLKRLAKDTLLFDSTIFVLESEFFNRIPEIKLINFSTGIEQNFEDSLFRYKKIGLRKSDSLELLFGGFKRLSTINDLPLYLHCHHCNTIRTNCIFIDQSVLLSDLKEVYSYLYYLSERRVVLITKVENGKFEGILDKIVFFEEDISIINESSNLRYPVPPSFSSFSLPKKDFKRFDFLEIKNSLNSIEEFEIFKREQCENENCLIEVNSELTSMEDFIKLKVLYWKFRVDQLEKISKSTFQKPHKELEMSEKKIVFRKFNGFSIILN